MFIYRLAKKPTRGFQQCQLVVVIILLSTLMFPTCALSWGKTTLNKAVTQLANDLVEQGVLQDCFVLISPNNLCDSKTGLSLPLANLLRDKLITAMKKNGVKVLLPGADEDEFMLLLGNWKTQGKDLAIDIQVAQLTANGPETIASASTLVPLSQIDAKDLTPDRNAWARYLVKQLENKALDHRPQTLHIAPFEGTGCNDEFKYYLVNWLRPALADCSISIPLDQAKKLRDISVSTLRTRGTRGISPQKKAQTQQHSLTANLLNADTELKGVFYKHVDSLEIQARICDRQGRQITAATVEVPASYFPPYLLNQSPVSSGLKQTTPASCATGITVNGLKIELTTTRGEDRPQYHNGEEIRFLMRLNRPAWVYLFDFNSDGEAVLLYPVDDNGHLANNRSGFLHAPEQPLILPDDGYSYELVAAKPFGTDKVLALAAESPLNLPADLSGQWSRADYLLEQLRLQGMKRTDGYSEAKIELVTVM